MNEEKYTGGMRRIQDGGEGYRKRRRIQDGGEGLREDQED